MSAEFEDLDGAESRSIDSEDLAKSEVSNLIETDENVEQEIAQTTARPTREISDTLTQGRNVPIRLTIYIIYL